MPPEIELPKTLLVVLALHALGGEGDLETIAVKAHELFPNEFCWRLFPQLPDKDAVRVHLSEAKKESFGRLVTDVDLRKQSAKGGHLKRFALTSAGLERARELADRYGGRAVGASKNPVDLTRLVQPLLDSAAFRKYVAGGKETLDRDGFLAAFKLFGDASDFTISARISRVEAAVSAHLTGDTREQALQFIRKGRHAFGFE